MTGDRWWAHTSFLCMLNTGAHGRSNYRSGQSTRIHVPCVRCAGKAAMAAQPESDTHASGTDAVHSPGCCYWLLRTRALPCGASKRQLVSAAKSGNTLGPGSVVSVQLTCKSVRRGHRQRTSWLLCRQGLPTDDTQ